MTQETVSSARRILLALSLTSLSLGAGCWRPDMKDAEIGCGVDANVNAKCLRPPSDAALSDPLDASVATDTATAGIDGAGTDNVSAPVDGATAIDTGGSD